MDWFERLTGFREQGYAQTRARLTVEGQRLCVPENGRSYGIGELELVSLRSLRERVLAGPPVPGSLRVRNVQGDVGRMHGQPEYAGALFQVASQFNLLEMIGPHVTPEDGVTRYAQDRTQGPACAIAAGAATVYRNYFACVEGASGQTAERQLDGLAEVGAELGRVLGCEPSALWSMRNGYAMCSAAGLRMINGYLTAAGPAALDALAGLLRVGVHRDVEVTAHPGPERPRVSQVFCSALPVAYAAAVTSPELWQPFATLVLDAAYEASLCAAVLNARGTGCNTVLLTRLGGGAFGNEDAWIDAALQRALTRARGFGLDVCLVSYGSVPPGMRELAQAFA